MKTVKNILLGMLLFCTFFKNEAQVLLPVELNIPGEVLLFKSRGNIQYLVSGIRKDANNMAITVMFKEGKGLWLVAKPIAVSNFKSVTDAILFESKIFLTGDFLVLGKADAKLAVYDLSQQLWIFKTVTNSNGAAIINCMEIYTRNKISYLALGGAFTAIGGESMSNLCKFRTVTNFASMFRIQNTVAGTNSVVTNLAVDTSGSIIIAGEFGKFLNNSYSSIVYWNTKDSTFSKDNLSIAAVKKILYLPVKNVSFMLAKKSSDSFFYLYAKTGLTGTNNWSKINAILNADSLSSLLWLDSLFICAKISTSIKTERGLFSLNTSTLQLKREFPFINSIFAAAMIEDKLWVSGTFIEGPSKRLKKYSVGIINRDIKELFVKVFADKNNNKQLDAGENALPGVSLRLKPSKIFNISDEDGILSFYLPKSVSIVEVEPILKQGTAVLRNIFIKTDTSDQRLNLLPINFNNGTNYSDIRVNINAQGGRNAIIDTHAYYTVKIVNDGLNTATTNVTLKFDKRLSIIDNGTGTINNGTITWTNVQIKPGNSISYLVALKHDKLNFTAGQSSIITASASMAIDNYPADNSDTLLQTTVLKSNSISKTQNFANVAGKNYAILPVGTSKLDYNITFYNLGTDTLYNAILTDTVDASDYVSYIQETGTNYPFTRFVYTSPLLPNKAVLVYTFSNLKLRPNPSGNPELPNSFVYFGIRLGLDPTLSGNAHIENTAYINENGVIYATNKVETFGPNLLAIKKPLALNNLLLYPNPVSDYLHIENKISGNFHLQLFNINGKLVLTEQGYNKLMLNTAQLVSGTYFIKITQNNQVQTAKIIKY